MVQVKKEYCLLGAICSISEEQVQTVSKRQKREEAYSQEIDTRAIQLGDKIDEGHRFVHGEVRSILGQF